MRLGIIGSGFCGLSTAYYLRNTPLDITILEQNPDVGGLSSWFKQKNWDWNLEFLIHHWFTSDKAIWDLVRELGLEKELIVKDTKSSCFYKGEITRFDSPISVLKFKHINLFSRLRTGLVMAILKLDPFYKKYENITAYRFLTRALGKKAFSILWEPLFTGKFSDYANKINAAWFWYRIHARTKKLMYMRGGFKTLIDSMKSELIKSNCKLHMGQKVNSIEKKSDKFIVKTQNKKFEFDIILEALPLEIITKITHGLDKDYKLSLEKLKTIGAQYFVFELKKSFLNEGTYWLNINEKDYPFMMVAEHTNFISKEHYGNSHIIWVGKYLNIDSSLWKMNEKELLEAILPYLKKINPAFDKSWIKSSVFRRFSYAQPIISLKYSTIKPTIKTPTNGLYIASMNHIYPADRGTNNAVLLGKKAADEIKNYIKK